MCDLYRRRRPPVHSSLLSVAVHVCVCVRETRERVINQNTRVRNIARVLCVCVSSIYMTANFVTDIRVVLVLDIHIRYYILTLPLHDGAEATAHSHNPLPLLCVTGFTANTRPCATAAL